MLFPVEAEHNYGINIPNALPDYPASSRRGYQRPLTDGKTVSKTEVWNILGINPSYLPGQQQDIKQQSNKFCEYF